MDDAKIKRKLTVEKGGPDWESYMAIMSEKMKQLEQERDLARAEVERLIGEARRHKQLGKEGEKIWIEDVQEWGEERGELKRRAESAEKESKINSDLLDEYRKIRGELEQKVAELEAELKVVRGVQN